MELVTKVRLENDEKCGLKKVLKYLLDTVVWYLAAIVF